jgi:hypothetical protein
MNAVDEDVSAEAIGSGHTLPCGRAVDTVWRRLDQVEAGLADSHEVGCVYCAAAEESLVVLRELTGRLAVEATTADAGPPELTGRIMSAVRADVRRRDMLPLPSAEPGLVRVSEQAVAVVLRFAADTVVGVHARHCRVRALDSPDCAVEVEMSIAVGYPEFAATALAEVRDRVVAAAGARIGVRLARFELALEDVYEA